MNNNMAAFLRENARTIKVRFFKDQYKQSHNDMTLLGDTELSQTEYIYLTTLELKVGDLVIVTARDLFQVVYVSEVAEDVTLDIADTVKYKWIVQKLDVTAYCKLLEENKKLEQIIATSYKQSVRGQFKQMLFQQLGADKIGEVNNLLGITATEA